MVKREFDGIVHHRNGEVLWASKREVIFQSLDNGVSWQRVLSLPIPQLSRIKAQVALSRRLFRMMVNHLHWLEDRYLVVLGFGRIFCFDFDDDKALVADTPLHGKRPLVLCKTAGGRLLYGEYRSNPERSAVSVWGSGDSGRTWRSECTLEGVRHIHGVFEDPYEDLLWITTGDEDHESAIWSARPDFSDLRKVVSGGQQARAITLEFSAEKVFYGTDTPLEKNHLYSLDRTNLVASKIAEVDGSVFHSCGAGGQMFFSTACEPSKVNLSGTASVYQVTQAGVCSLLISRPKDFWPKKLFQYGQVFLATGQEDYPEIWMTPFATTQDQKSVLWEFNNEDR